VRFVYDGEKLLVENDSTNTPQTEYTQGDSGASANGGYGNLVSQFDEGTSSSYQFGFDALGSTGALLDSSGAAADRWQYSAFGLQNSAPMGEPTRLTYGGQKGYQFDLELDLYYCRNRYYDPVTGRWVNQDPAQHDEVNTYRYVGNNPVNALDPSGLGGAPHPSSGRDPWQVAIEEERKVAYYRDQMEWQLIAIEAMSSSFGYSVKQARETGKFDFEVGFTKANDLKHGYQRYAKLAIELAEIQSDPSSGRGFFELPISLPPYIELFAPGTLNELYKIYKKAAENWGVVAQKADQNYHELLWMKEKVDTAEKILAVATGVGVAVQGGKLIAKEGIEVGAKYLTKELLIFAAGYGATVGAAAAAKEAGVNPTVIDVGVRAALLLLLLRAASAATESSAPLDAKKFVESIDNPDKALTELKVLTEPPTATSPSPTRANAPGAAVRQTLGRSANSTVLGQNLEAVSGATRPANSAAHHIVSGEAQGAAQARAILAREGIDINEAANGVFLPANRSVAVPPAQTHSTVHTNAYYNAVNQRLADAAPGTVRSVLADIAQELLNGTFPH
jgi:RHS repeat-associated protein